MAQRCYECEGAGRIYDIDDETSRICRECGGNGLWAGYLPVETPPASQEEAEEEAEAA